MSTSGIKALVQGASRGIGLQFCRSLLSRQPNTVIIATCRKPEKASELHHLQSESEFQNRLHIIKTDVTEENDIKVTIYSQTCL